MVRVACLTAGAVSANCLSRAPAPPRIIRPSERLHNGYCVDLSQRGGGVNRPRLLAKTDPASYERAALRWLERFIEERLPPLTEVALAASALASSSTVSEMLARRR